MKRVNINITESEAKLLLEFLEELADTFSHAGCNDYSLENTPGNKEIYSQIWEGFSKEDIPEIDGDTLYCGDYQVLKYLTNRIKTELKGK